jgi:hypothetical protein
MCNKRGGILDMSLERFKPNCRMRGHKAARLGKNNLTR